MVVKSFAGLARAEQWSLLGVVVAGLLLMLVAKFVLKSPFFNARRESDSGAGAIAG
jgi:hypothetical protein